MRRDRPRSATSVAKARLLPVERRVSRVDSRDGRQRAQEAASRVALPTTRAFAFAARPPGEARHCFRARSSSSSIGLARAAARRLGLWENALRPRMRSPLHRRLRPRRRARHRSTLGPNARRPAVGSETTEPSAASILCRRPLHARVSWRAPPRVPRRARLLAPDPSPRPPVL
jgi:hypothetical protein